MKIKLIRTSIFLGVLFSSFSCSEPSKDLTSVFKPILEVNLKDSPLLSSIGNLSFVGKIERDDSLYLAMYDRRIGSVHYFNQATNKRRESFAVPINDSISFFPAMLSIISWDRLLYFNTFNQTLVTTSRKRILNEKQIRIGSGELPWKIENSFRNLKFDTNETSILLTNWVNYSKAKNPDSLMDERFLYVKVDTSSLASQFIPLKPKYKRNTGDNLAIYDIMYYVLQDNKGRYIGFNSFLNEIMIYDRSTYQEKTVRGTNFPIEKIIRPRTPTADERRKSLIGKRAHKIFYSSEYNKFIRRIRNWEIEETRDIHTFLFEVLNDNFEVESVIDLGKQEPVFYQSGDNVYLKIFDRPSQKLTLYEYKS